MRGTLELSCQGERWTAINVLPIESYLEAVLGSEMLPELSLWKLSRLRLLRVAARSYALQRKIEARQEGASFHLSSTILSQVYAGV